MFVFQLETAALRNPGDSITHLTPLLTLLGPCCQNLGPSINVLLVKIEGPVWYTIYHHRNLLLKGFLQTPLFSSTNQWEFGTSMPFIIYPYKLVINPLTSINYRYINIHLWDLGTSSKFQFHFSRAETPPGHRRNAPGFAETRDPGQGRSPPGGWKGHAF